MQVAMHLWLLFMAIVASTSVVAEKIEHQSFAPPFDDYNTVGSRTIPQWRSGGDTAINSTFVRLFDS